MRAATRSAGARAPRPLPSRAPKSARAEPAHFPREAAYPTPRESEAFARLREGDGLYLDKQARRKLGHLERRTRRRLVTDMLRVDLIHAVKVVEVRQEDGRLDEAIHSASGGLEDRPQVRQGLLRLLLDRLPDRRWIVGLDSHLSGDEDEPRGLDRLRIRRPLERCRCCLGSYDLLHWSSLLRGRHAWASATPSALKIDSSTCWLSLPSSSRTCRVKPAVCANSSRKRAARSPARPAIRACETRSGRPEASSATCARASSTGTTAEPWPRTPSARSGSASASPSDRAAAVISTSGLPGSTSSAKSNDA